MHAQMWHDRLQTSRRYLAAFEELRPLLENRGEHTLRTARAVGGDDDGATLAAGRDEVVTEAQVWDALAEIPDPEIPVISLVDLGVVRDVTVDERTKSRRLHADVPRLPGARGDARRDGRRRSARSAPSRRSTSAWTTRGRPTASRRRAARSSAPPASRRRRRAKRPRRRSCSCRATPIRCPYCGSTETRLENIFGPTPCRSLRYCATCRQPFEQFKTI